MSETLDHRLYIINIQNITDCRSMTDRLPEDWAHHLTDHIQLGALEILSTLTECPQDAIASIVTHAESKVMEDRIKVKTDSISGTGRVPVLLIDNSLNILIDNVPCAPTKNCRRHRTTREAVQTLQDPCVVGQIVGNTPI